MSSDSPCEAAEELPGGRQVPAELADVIRKELDYLLRHRHSDPGKEANTVARSLVGLALSGGGIRSATTNLGMLQELARLDILPMVDYMSTVSGGGYIGACLASLLSWNGVPRTTLNDPCAPFRFGPPPAPKFTTAWEKFPFRAEYQE
jgi:patatin-like phospholipase